MRILALAVMLLSQSGCWVLFDSDDDGGGGPCVPRTCDNQGFECGSATDGCGQTLECGTCDQAGWECGVDQPNVCGCVPYTCAQELATCGEIQDGCGSTFVCGPCDGPSECGVGGDDHVCALSGDLKVCDEDSGFCWENPYPVPFTPFDAFARTDDDIWAVGYEGQIRHFDGTRWSAVPSGVDVLLRGVWASSATNAWAVGLQGTLLHWDGETWEPVDLGTTADLNDVHGTTQNNVWVVGSGVGFKWNGAAWQPATTSTPPTLYHVYSASATKVWATGGGRVWEWSATSWTAQTVDDDDLTLNGIAGRGEDEIYAVGWEDDGSIFDPDFDHDELVYSYDGGLWTRIDTAAQGPIDDIYVTGSHIVAVRTGSLFAISGPSLTAQPAGALAVGAGTADDLHVVLGQTGGPQRYLGGAWVDDRYGPGDNVDVAGVVDGAVWFTAGADVVAWIGGGAVVTTPPPGQVLAMAGASPNDAVAALPGGLYAFDGHGWTSLAGAPAGVVALREAGGALHALGAAIHARGEDGTWALVHEALDRVWADLAEDAAGDLWAVGTRTVEAEHFGAIARRQGGDWSEQSLAGFTGLCSVLVVAENEVWIGGWSGSAAQVAHWNGDAWSPAEELGAVSACDLRALEGGDIAAVSNGALWRRTGGEWAEWLAHPTGSFTALEADASGGLWLAGTEGAILHRPPPE